MSIDSENWCLFDVHAAGGGGEGGIPTAVLIVSSQVPGIRYDFMVHVTAVQSQACIGFLVIFIVHARYFLPAPPPYVCYSGKIENASNRQAKKQQSTTRPQADRLRSTGPSTRDIRHSMD